MRKNSSEFNYFIGLFVADGHLSKDGRHLEYTSKDLELVNYVKEILQLGNKISKKSRSRDKEKKYYRIQFGNIELYKYLLEIGIPQDKSLNIKSVKIDDKFIYDFTRGLFDGDGSITFYNHPASKIKQVKFRISSGSKDFLEWLRKIIGDLGSVRKGRNVYELVLCKRDTIEIIKKLYYSDQVKCLKRKRDRCLYFLESNIDFKPEKWQNRYTSQGGEIGKLASLRN